MQQKYYLLTVSYFVNTVITKIIAQGMEWSNRYCQINEHIFGIILINKRKKKGTFLSSALSKSDINAKKMIFGCITKNQYKLQIRKNYHLKSIKLKENLN